MQILGKIEDTNGKYFKIFRSLHFRAGQLVQQLLRASAGFHHPHEKAARTISVSQRGIDWQHILYTNVNSLWQGAWSSRILEINFINCNGFRKLKF